MGGPGNLQRLRPAGVCGLSRYFDPGTGHPVSDGNHVRCPMCGCEAEARHIGRGRGGKQGKSYWPLTITRIGDKLALVGWCVGKYISCEGRESISCQQYEAYVVEEHKVVRLMPRRFAAAV